MEIPEILKALERNTGVFPREALEEAVRRREEITPELLRILEDTVARAEQISEEDTEGSYFAHLYAMYLLAQFRETRAYPLVAQYARLPEETLDSLTGDFVTEGLYCVLASVCGGDTALIEALIEDSEAAEYARGAGIRALVVLVAAGDKTRDEVIDYFKALFDGRLERSFSEVWNELVSSATDLYPDEVYDKIVAAYQDGLVESFCIRLEDVDEVLAVDRQTVLDRFPKGAPVYIRDVIEEMEWWCCFNPPKRSKRSKKTPVREPRRQDAEYLFRKAAFPNPRKLSWMFDSPPNVEPVESHESEPAELSEFPLPSRSSKIGPNERCPCGSGKKYKKCCGRQDVNSSGGTLTMPPDVTGHAGMSQKGMPVEWEAKRERVDHLDVRREAEYIINKAQGYEACIVTCGLLVFFSALPVLAYF